MGSLEYLWRMGGGADPGQREFHADPLYLILNLAVPLLLGVLLGTVIKIVERMVRMKRERRKGK
jgi:hypothetical protein